jgi:chemotaxis protein methyltransferase CheR
VVRFNDIDDGERITEEAQFLSNEADYMKFLERLYREEGIDLSLYKQNQMRRRLNMTVRQAGQLSYCGFLDYAKLHEDIYRRFIDRITINVSEFFRNPDKFEILEQKFLIPLLKRTQSPTIWSAGCSTGEEPYTLALLLEKYNVNPMVKILGWDFDKNALKRAADGIYEDKAVAGVPKPLLDKYFNRLDSGHVQVNEVLKRRIRLEKHNLLEDRFPTGLDAILCRNVVIYFKDRAKEDLFVRFAQALDRNGVLMIGASERIPNVEEAKLRALEPFFYVRTDSTWPDTGRRTSLPSLNG